MRLAGPLLLLRLLSGLVGVGVLFSCVIAHAQPRPEEVQAAATAFREGQTAQLSGDYGRAAELFELADHTAPSAAALRSALRNRQAAGDAARAASHALEALARYPDDAETVALAQAAIAELGPQLALLHLDCAPECSASIDGHVLSAGAATRVDAYLDPGDHELVASWAGLPTRTQMISLVAGQEAQLLFSPPDAEPVPVTPEPEPEPVTEPEPEPETPPPSGSSGLTPVIFAIGAGLTAVALGVTIGSGVDVLGARDAYVMMPTMAGYQNGIDRELRTNVLIGVSAALGAGTLVVAFVTDWGGSTEAPDASATAGVDSFVIVPTNDGAFSTLGGHF